MADLDLSGYEQALHEDFLDAALDPSFDVRWGPADALTISGSEVHIESTADDGWQDVGLIQGPRGAESGQGYGYYEFTARLEEGQGAGVALLLWPGTNGWPGPEIDVLESADPARDQGFWAVHWNEGGRDGFDWFPFQADLTQQHRYGLEWEGPSAENPAGRLSYYLDGVLLGSTTEHVPLDAASGGENLVIAMQVTGAGRFAQPSDAVRVHVDEVSYWAPGEEPAGWPYSASLPAAEDDRPEEGEAEAASPEVPAATDWNALAAREQAWFEKTGAWGAPGDFLAEGLADAGHDWAPAPEAAEDWNALAAQARANFDATGAWFV